MKKLQEEFERQHKLAMEKKAYAEQHPKSKEARIEHRKVGLLLLGIAIFLSAPQVLAFLFDAAYYPRLLIFTIVLALFSLVIILTGWLPKLPPRR